MTQINSILNFIKGKGNEKYHFVSYHTDEADKVVIDWAGTKDDITENSFMTFGGSARKASRPELEKALKNYLLSHEVKPFTIDMVYQRIRENHNIK